MAQMQAFQDDELMDREVLAAAGLDLGPEAEPDELPVIPCQWIGCEALFWEIEPLLAHLNAVHIEGQSHPNGKFSCEWQGCTRMSKPAATRSAMVAHLRSHTGERPYSCPRPECDKTFSRMDALQKHGQNAHDEAAPAGRKPPASKKRKLDDAASMADDAKREEGDESGDDGTPAPTEQQPVAAPEEMVVDDEADDEALARAIARHPEQLPAFVRYIVTAAKHKYAISEHASLIDELDLLEGVEAEMREEKDALVERVTIQQLGRQAAEHWAKPYPPYGGLVAWQPQSRSMLPPGRFKPQLGKYSETAVPAAV